MRHIMYVGAVLLIASALFLSFIFLQEENEGQIEEEVMATSTSEEPTEQEQEGQNISPPEEIAVNLTIPWDIVFLPDGGMLVTERDGGLLAISQTGDMSTITIPDVRVRGEGGLLGATLHPTFAENNYIYLYLTSTLGGSSVNKVVRYIYSEGELTNETLIIGNIPGALFHNGGRIAFGPDGYLYIATGDATDPSSAQALDSIAGKILRVDENGNAAPENPFNSMVYSYGHRNPQGLTWDSKGKLWSTEHGRSGIRSGLDELNLIEKGGNYGWPDSQGDTVESGTIRPKAHSGPSVTWAPASALYWGESIFFAGLKGETLYEAILENDDVKEIREHFVGEYGRLRTIVLGPDELFYLTTSNQDGRGDPAIDDDKILKIDPRMFE